MLNLAIIGSPNVGKSLLFNQLTGLSHKVANFSGATVSVGSGNCILDSSIKISDYPGVYSLQKITGEEGVAIDRFTNGLASGEIDCVAVVLDSTRLEKSLVFALQVRELCFRHETPLFFVANLVDVLQQNNMQFDSEGLSRELATPIIEVSAKKKLGLDNLLKQAHKLVGEKAQLSQLEVDIDTSVIVSNADIREQGLALKLAEQYGPKGDLLVKSSAKVDRFLLGSISGGLFFFLIMYFLFQSIFTWAAPLMDAVESGLSITADWLVPLLPGQITQDFFRDALFGGVGAFLVFVPQIFVLTFIVGLLEDSGYLARAAIICHRPLKWFGLSGKSFIPMLSGVACAIPGIFAARTVDSPLKRTLTYMAVPLMPCSARLPVYTLLIAAFIPATTLFGGIVGLQGAMMFGVYLFGMLMGLLVTALVSRVGLVKDDDLPFVLEVPPYRLPGIKPLISTAWDRSMQFISKAGPIIFVVSVVVWVLGYFPNQGQDLSQSYMAVIGQFIEPIFEPLGLDWRYGVAILTSFLAREVFVGTLGTLLGIENSDENIISLAEKVQSSGLPLSVGIGLLVFFAISLMCVSTLAILRREAGSWKLPVQMFVAYGVLAYVFALLAKSLASFFLS